MTVSSHDLLQLRVLVLALGEAPNAGWWKSQFLTTTGLSYLERLYPRSSFAAAVRSAGEAARLVHDSSIGVGQVFHLFRLPLDEERRLETVLEETAAELQAEWAPLLPQSEQLLARLEQLANGPPARAASGPQEVGRLRDWQAGKLLAPLAGMYAAAFHGGTRVFPYIRADVKLG